MCITLLTLNLFLKSDPARTISINSEKICCLSSDTLFELQVPCLWSCDSCVTLASRRYTCPSHMHSSWVWFWLQEFEEAQNILESSSTELKSRLQGVSAVPESASRPQPKAKEDPLRTVRHRVLSVLRFKWKVGLCSYFSMVYVSSTLLSPS